MVEDYTSTSHSNNIFLKNRLLNDINNILLRHHRSLKDFDLPQLDDNFQNMGDISGMIQNELAIPVPDEDLQSVHKLNLGQLQAFNTIREAIDPKKSYIFFVDGPGGTGKTYLYRALLAHFRKDGLIMLASATSGIAATQLPGGRTSHSLLKIPIKLESNSVCYFSKQSELCHLLKRASAIIWDETPMAHRKSLETVDRTLRDMLQVDKPFGGMIMIFGGDFRQVVPVVAGGTRSQTIQASIVQSYLWSHVNLLQLKDNVRARDDTSFSDFLLRVGNGEEPIVENNMIKIPDTMVISWQNEQSIDELIAWAFPNLESNYSDVAYMTSRALLTPKNEDVKMLNEKVIEIFPGNEATTYYSFDYVADDLRNLYLPEFLNSLSPGNLPPHKLTLKKGCPIMLLRNLDLGLCNGTRMVCHGFGTNFIDAEVLTGSFKGKRIFLPRIPMEPSEDARLPFKMTRKQFPVRLSFALTINKSQGQTIPHVGIYLPEHVFSHGQLYVALSRGVSQLTTKLLVKKGELEGHEGVYTRNVVYPEIFTKLTNNRRNVTTTTPTGAS